MILNVETRVVGVHMDLSLSLSPSPCGYINMDFPSVSATKESPEHKSDSPVDFQAEHTSGSMIVRCHSCRWLLPWS